MRYLKVLGSGDAFATGGIFTTSFYVFDKENGGFLIDCGASTLPRLRQEKISLRDIHTIYITHFHGDHYGGLPFLFISMKFQQLQSFPLTIAGPKGLKDQLFKLQDALYPGTGDILDELNLHIVEYDLEWQQLGDVAVKAYPVTHSPPSKPHGLKFRVDSKMIAFSGDTEWDENLVKLAEGTDLFITECNNYKSESPGHVSYQTLQDKRSQLNSKRICISHMGQEMLDLEDCEFEKLNDGSLLRLW